MLVYIGKYPNSKRLLSKVVEFVLTESQLEKFSKFCTDRFYAKKPFLFNTFFAHKNVDGPRVFVKLNAHDTWSSDWSLSNIIVPLLVKLKESKVGVPYVDEEDVPEDVVKRVKGLDPDSDGYYASLEHNWNWVIDEMIWAMNQIRTNEEDAPYYKKLGEQKIDPLQPFALNLYSPEEDEAYAKRIANGTRLFGKYYRTLWT